MLRRVVWMTLIPIACFSQTGSLQLGMSSNEVWERWHELFYWGVTDSELNYLTEGKLVHGGLNLTYKKFTLGFTMISGKLYGNRDGEDIDEWFNVLLHKGYFQTKTQLDIIEFKLGYEIWKSKDFKLYLCARSLSFDLQHLMTDGIYYIIGGKYFEIPVENLHSSYISTNKGYGLGMEGSGRKIQFAITFYPWIETRGDGHWNLRDMDFCHFIKSRAVRGEFQYTIPVYRFLNFYLNYHFSLMWYHKNWKQDTVYVGGEWEDWGNPHLDKDTKWCQGIGGGLKINF